jgi:hypothetical protein
VDVLAGRQVHHRVGTPKGGPTKFVDFFFDRRRDYGVTDVCVDLHLEIAADDHRLELGVIDVGGDDGAAACNFGSHEVRIHALAQRDKLHLACHFPAPRVVHLGNSLPCLCSARLMGQRVRDQGVRALGRAGVGRRANGCDVAASFDPFGTQLRQPMLWIGECGPARVVHAKRRFTARQPYLTKRDA